MSEIAAHITGNVWKIEVKVGDSVAEDDTVVILESMKMEIAVAAPADGVVAAISVAPGDHVARGQLLAELERNPPAPVTVPPAPTQFPKVGR